MPTDTNHTLYLVANENYRMLTWYCERLEQENYWEQPQKIMGYSIYEFLELYLSSLLIELADTLEKTDQGHQEYRKFILVVMKQNLLHLSLEEKIPKQTIEEAKRILKAPPILLQLCGLRDLEKKTSITGLFFDALLNIMLAFGALDEKKDPRLSTFLKDFYEKIKVFLYYGEGEELLDETYLFYKLCNKDLVKYTEGLSLAGESFEDYLEKTLKFKCRRKDTIQEIQEETEVLTEVAVSTEQEVLQEQNIDSKEEEQTVSEQEEILQEQNIDCKAENESNEQENVTKQEENPLWESECCSKEVLQNDEMDDQEQSLEENSSMPRTWADLRAWADAERNAEHSKEMQDRKEEEKSQIVIQTTQEKGGQAHLEQLLEKLNHLVGLKEVKQEIHSLVNLIQIRKLRKQYHLPEMEMSYHMVFTGNPGTGKTTVARLVAEIYKELGLLSKGTLVETDRSGLVAGYIGQTALKVKEVVEHAMGGVLFIDEAYSLASNLGVNDFGGEAIDTLVKLMEDKRDDLVIIAAGYTEEMQKFLKANTGLVSRFNKFIEFQDYTNQELMEILISMAEEAGFHFEQETIAIIQNYLETRDPEEIVTFGNARGIRNMFEKLVVNQANRIVNYETLTIDQLSSITAEDAASWKRENTKPRKRAPRKRKTEDAGAEKTNKCLKKRAEIHKLQDA